MYRFRLVLATQHHQGHTILKILNDAADGTLIRVYAYMLTDPFAIDMLIRYGKACAVRLTFISYQFFWVQAVHLSKIASNGPYE